MKKLIVNTFAAGMLFIIGCGETGANSHGVFFNAPASINEAAPTPVALKHITHAWHQPVDRSYDSSENNANAVERENYNHENAVQKENYKHDAAVRHEKYKHDTSMRHEKDLKDQSAKSHEVTNSSQQKNDVDQQKNNSDQKVNNSHE